MRRPALSLAALSILLSPLILGCSYRNQALNAANVPLEHRAPNQTRAALVAEIRPRQAITQAAAPPEVRPTLLNGHDRPPFDPKPDGYFVGVAISGGGSRSANFAAACMFQLERLGLLDRVDYISSVSGGSLTAAYYCTHGDGPGGWNPGNVQRLLSHAFANDLLVQTLLPWNAVAVATTDLDRSDLLTDIFQQTLYSRPDGRPMTFADLRAERPRLLINSTNLQSGRRFVFSNESFDEINSDLAKFPIAQAVTASAAVPVLLHHVTLRDFSTVFQQYVHLIDGGVTDNLGIESLAEVYSAHVAQAAAAGGPDPYPNGAILIVIDATTRFDATLSNQSDFGFLTSLVTGAGLSTTALINRVSSATLADLIVRYAAGDVTADRLREHLAELEKSGYLELTGRGGRRVRVVHLALSHVADLTDLPFESFDKSVNNIATYFNINPTEAYYLYQAAELLVREQFEPHLADIVGEMRSADDKVTR